MSPSERGACIRIASILIVFVPYFVHVGHLLASDGPIGRRLCVAFFVAALAHGILTGLARHSTGSRSALRAPTSAIDAISLRVAYFTLTPLVVFGLGTTAFVGAVSPVSATGSVLLPTFAPTSQFVLLCTVAPEAARHATQPVCHRRAAVA